MSVYFNGIQSDDEARQRFAEAEQFLALYQQRDRDQDSHQADLELGLVIQYAMKRSRWEQLIQALGMRATLMRTRYERLHSWDDKREAEDALKFAIDISQKHGFDHYVALAKNSLGLLWLVHLKITMDDVERSAAIEGLHDAITFWESAPAGIAPAKNRYNIALAYSHLYDFALTEVEFVGDQADAAFADAQAGWPINHPSWPPYSINMAQARHNMRRWEREGKSARLEDAKNYALMAIKQMAEAGNFGGYVDAKRLAARIYALRDDFGEAADQLLELSELLAQTLLQCRSIEERLYQLRAFAPARSERASYLAQLGRLDEAVREVDRGKSVRLTEQLLLRQAVEKKLNQSWGEYKRRLGLLDSLPDVASMHFDEALPGLKKIAGARASIIEDNWQVREHLEELRRFVPGQDLQVPMKLAILHISEGAFGLEAYLVQAGRIDHITLFDVVSKTDVDRIVYAADREVMGWQEMLSGCHKTAVDEARGDEEAMAARQDDPADARHRCNEVLAAIAEKNAEKATGYYNSYHLLYSRLNYLLPASAELADLARVAATTQFDACLDRTAQFVKSKLFSPVLPKLSHTIDHLLISGTSDLSLLPLHLGCPERLAVGQIPSIEAWMNLRRKSVCPREHRSAAIFAPASDLPMSIIEAYLVWRRLAGDERNVSLYLGDQATFETFSEIIEHVETLHFAGHATFAWKFLDFTKLVLHDRPISMRQLQRHLGEKFPPFVFLSACESGLVDGVSFGNEMVGLPSALLEMGASAVVSSAWPVYDLATAFYCGEFYSHVFEPGVSVSQAVRKSSRTLSELTREQLLCRLATIPITDEGRVVLKRLCPDVSAPSDDTLPPGLDRQKLTEQVINAAWVLALSEEERPLTTRRYSEAFSVYGAGE
ncbi:CHAT domain-containing protein [Blastopirellula retiformator]|uniref:CHAT domain protein n=1 Tax=Blastopirellula retiformator TaxID=2527970 RepID=A0A5C5V0X4_9BACT|nr:CHAT domain-containing protein [Blastopirellula retiformator]TWT31669.1 CHAT domain protein [Blastopirellula retiformator]